MTDQQQQQQAQQGEERRITDIESGMDEVSLENEDDSSSPAAAYRDLYIRMHPSQQGSGTLQTVGENSPLRPRTTSTASSCSSLADDVGVSNGCLDDDTEDEEDDIMLPAFPVKRNVSGVSNVTAKYDLNGKGYLDDTEKAMRALDTSNRGTLDMHKVYLVMKEMQQQQAELHEQQKSFANLKKVVIVLACFSMVLALANLGTAFAAATLAKDTKVDADTGSLLAKGSGESISTVSTGSVLHLEESSMPENVYDRRELRVARRTSAVFLGRLGDLAAPPEELLCPHPALGEIKEDEVEELRRNIKKGVSYVNIKYSYKNPDSGKKIRSDLSLHIEESNDEEGEGLHIRCTRTVSCKGRKECENSPQYRLAPEDFRFEAHGNGKFGLYSCHSSQPVVIGKGGLGSHHHHKGNDGDRRDL